MSLNHFRVIRGSFVVRGFQPDGDSVRFEADDPHRFVGLYRDIKDQGKVGPRQVRMEAIDAPETHYETHSQPLGDQARDRLLQHLGFTQVELSDETVNSCQPAAISGAILTQAFDPHGRPISYVMAGAASDGLIDGAEIVVGADLLDKSANASMIRDGFAYPLLYTSAPDVHRQWFRELAQKTKARGVGIWSQDHTPDFDVSDEGALSTGHGKLIFPKFFRRCMDFLAERARGGPATLPEWMRSSPDKNDDVIVSGKEGLLDQIFHQDGQRVTVGADLLDLVFVEK